MKIPSLVSIEKLNEEIIKPKIIAKIIKGINSRYSIIPNSLLKYSKLKGKKYFFIYHLVFYLVNIDFKLLIPF